MYVAFRPFSRSMSTPSKPYVCITEYTLFARFAADVASLTDTVPRSPPTTEPAAATGKMLNLPRFDASCATAVAPQLHKRCSPVTEPWIQC
jgi:hypothetical protein